MLALAVDLGGTKVEGALVDAGGALVPGSRARRATGPDITRDGLAEAITQVVSEALANAGEIVGVGIGSAGPIDVPGGTVRPLNLPRAQDLPIVEIVSRAASAALGRTVPITLALDGLCITLAEHWLGAARHVGSALGMVVSTGVGGGIVSRGVPVRGGTGNAGHIGQLEVAGFAPDDVHGLEATVERIASGPNIVRWAREQGWAGSTGEDLAASYAAGDPVARSAVRRSAFAVGAAIASATALLDIDIVVIGGGFARVSPDYLELVREGRDRFAAYPFMARADIVPAALGADSPLIGAAALVLRADA
ncbi:hypothetical protein DDQ50_15105 [Amnibacterium flavum]|uniref:ROK family protein n=2 Tax=Amnibacterium flavum TaxID=2173173 RepID=A0A2V1HML8_9MICO|nr:hypothetical protein DDQ50_15105 [Amnibacterium flavum]